MKWSFKTTKTTFKTFWLKQHVGNNLSTQQKKTIETTNFEWTQQTWNNLSSQKYKQEKKLSIKTTCLN